MVLSSDRFLREGHELAVVLIPYVDWRLGWRREVPMIDEGEWEFIERVREEGLDFVEVRR